MASTTGLEPSAKHPGGRNAPGGPPGNQKAVTHGLHGLKRMRKSGKLDKRTAFGRAFEAKKAEYVSHYGSDQLSAMELALSKILFGLTSTPWLMISTYPASRTLFVRADHTQLWIPEPG